MMSRSGRFPVMVIAHRGFSGKAPENTLSAFRKAIEAGSDIMELDVRLSKDGQVVVIHDETLERTTTGQGRVADFTLEELQHLDAGLCFGPQFAGEKIPALRKVLELAKRRILVNIEIKNGFLGEYTIRDLAERTMEEVEKAEMLNQVIFSSFYPAALERIRQKNLRARVALLFHHRWNRPREVTGGKPFASLNLRKIYLNKSKIAGIHEEGMKVNAYTVNSEKEMERLIRWEVDGIITNYPDRLIKILQKKFRD